MDPPEATPHSASPPGDPAAPSPDPPQAVAPPTDGVDLALQGLFFLSGSAGLMYEVTWTHQFANLIGSTSESMSMVFAVFLAGLALGSFLVGDSARAARRPLTTFGLLELGIGLLGAGSCLLLVFHEGSLLASLPGRDQGAARFFANAGLVALLVGPPTVLMGGSLPVLLAAVHRWRPASGVAARFYGLNTLGASLGAIVPGAFLIPRIGLSGTALVAMVINVGVGLGALVLARRHRAVWEQPPAAPEAQAEPAATGADEAAPPEPEAQAAGAPADDDPEAAAPTALSPALLAGLSFFSGATVLCLEICWGRLGRFALGNRALAVSTLLFGVLVFLGSGSILYDRLRRRLRHRPGWTPDHTLVGLLITTGLAQLVFGIYGIELASAPMADAFAALVAFLFALLGPFLSGALLFPWLMTHHPRLDRDTQKAVGRLYAVNVVGSCVGSIAATYLLVETLGTPATMYATSGLFLLVAAGLGARVGGLGRMGLALGGALAVWALAGATVHPWRVLALPPGQTLVDYREDRYGVQTLVRNEDGTLTASQNNARLVAKWGRPQTYHAQHMEGDLPMLLAKDPREVLNIGTGFGIATGAATLWGDALERFVTVEILPFVIDHQRTFARENHSFMDHPKAELVQGDGRYYLTASEKKWDAIVVSPLDAAMPGSSAIYTLDFMEEAKQRLKPGGVYVALLWGQGLRLLLRGLMKVFPRVRIYRAYSFSVVAVASADPDFDFRFHTERITPDVRAAWARLGVEDLEMYLQEVQAIADLDTEALYEEDARLPPPVYHTSDRPILEYSTDVGASPFRTHDETW